MCLGCCMIFDFLHKQRCFVVISYYISVFLVLIYKVVCNICVFACSFSHFVFAHLLDAFCILVVSKCIV